MFLIQELEKAIYQKSISQMIASIENELAANGIKGLETGIICAGTVSSITCHWMSQILKGFQELYPNLQLGIKQTQSARCQPTFY